MPRTNRPKRRVNPNEAPWDQLAVIAFHPDEAAIAARDALEPDHADWTSWDRTPLGTITVLREDPTGDFTVDTDLEPYWVTRMAEYPDAEHVVSTDATGHHTLTRVGWLVDAEKAATDPKATGELPLLVMPKLDRDDPAATLTGYAAQLREHARRALEVADEYDALDADGWELVPVMPEPGYYPSPLRRRAAPDQD